ncbi:MAG: putative transcriptional regulator [Glaciihabitans sp.]|nr:putative transcriptional regulator [Glaciihabitans sp.]
MDITLLRYFVAVAEELHFARAAENLNISRAKLGSGIRKLEEQVGFPLFDPTARPTRMTKAGELLLVEARLELAKPQQPKAPKPPAGGKAKASKGKGRAPAVKGQPQPNKRQGR